jgi:glucoamylase
MSIFVTSNRIAGCEHLTGVFMSARMGRTVLAAILVGLAPATRAFAANLASDGPGVHATWTTGNKIAVGTSATGDNKVWFTVAKGITTEVFYPRLDIPNMQDMQYIVTDGASFAELERDATDHVVSMPDEKALEYTIINTDKRSPPKYRITSTYVTDPKRNTLLIRTKFESLAGEHYQLYVRMNPSMAGGGGNDQAWWDQDNAALMASGTELLFGTNMTIVSALKIAGPNGFVAHDNGYTGMASDCAVDLLANFRLDKQFDGTASNGNVVQCGQVGDIGTGTTTFTLALGYGHDAASALAAAKDSLATGFPAVEAEYRSGWRAYVSAPFLKPLPASVTSTTQRKRAYQVALMTLHAAEDKTFPGANIAALATPWGDFQNGDALNDGYHRVWGRDLYHQATGLIAAGDFAHALRMTRFMWDRQFISKPTTGENITYAAGSFPRYSPVSGIAGASPLQLGCCEQLDQSGFAIVLAWMTGLTDEGTYAKIKAAAQHIQSVGPATVERWEEMPGKSPSSIAAEIAGLIAAADIARQNGDTSNAVIWEATADAWLAYLPAWALTNTGTWGGHPGHGVYFERLDQTASPNDNATIHLANGDFPERDVVDFGFLELARLGLVAPNHWTIAGSLAPTAQASDKSSAMQIRLPNGNVYFRRYVHDYYGESNLDCSGWPANAPDRYGRPWPLLSGERGEYELANGRPAVLYLQSMADATNDGYFVPEQIWDQSTIACFPLGKPTGSVAPLTWAEGQYLRLAHSIDRNLNLETPTVVLARYGGARAIVSHGTRCLEAGDRTIKLVKCNRSSAQVWTWNSQTGALQTQGKCMEVADRTATQLQDCRGSLSQEWRWRMQSRLVHASSGRCLEATGSSKAQLRDCTGSPQQTWFLP